MSYRLLKDDCSIDSILKIARLFFQSPFTRLINCNKEQIEQSIEFRH
jgi:hypothetical protein